MFTRNVMVAPTSLGREAFDAAVCDSSSLSWDAALTER
jgi:hypothetical protein